MEESGADVEVVEVDGGAERATGQTAFNRVDRAFFDVFGVRFRAGRKFDATDFGRGQSHAIVVNRTFATEIAGTENALGRRVRYTTPQDPGVSPEPWYEIVGVVEDFPANNHRATVYHPLLPAPVHQVSFTLRVGPDAGLAAARLREVTKAIDPALRYRPAAIARRDLPAVEVCGPHAGLHAWLGHADRSALRDGRDVHAHGVHRRATVA